MTMQKTQTTGYDLKAFLQQQGAVGSVDSEGSFTITREKRKQKLAQFALVEEYDWVLKLVQAANRWRCRHLVVSQTRVATSFLFVPGEESNFPADSEIIEGLEGSIDNKDVNPLSLALRSLVEQVDLSFVLAVRKAGELSQPIFAGYDIERLDPKTRKRWSATGDNGIRLTVSHFRSNESLTGRYLPTLTTLESRDLKIADSLKVACFASAVPIFLDGFCITEFANDPVLGKTRFYRPFVQAVRADRAKSYESHVYSARADSFGLTFEADLAAADRFYIRVGEWWELDRFLGRSGMGHFLFPDDSNKLTANMEAHRMFWTKEGVVVATQRIPNRCVFSTAYIVCCADHLRTDLSGLQIEFDSEALRVGARVLDSMAKVLRSSRVEWTNQSLDLDWTPEEEELDCPDLEAGYSLFTRSLNFANHFSDYVQSRRKKIRHVLIDFKYKSEYLAPWAKTVRADLNSIADDLNMEAQGLRRSQDS